MNEAARLKAASIRRWQTTPTMKRLTSYVLLALVFFLLGLLPIWARSQDLAAQLSQREQQVRLAHMQSSLGSAVIDAQRGDYDLALQAASTFFTSLRAELDNGDASAFSATQQTALQPLFSGRDDLIALLARADPAASARLSDLYASFRQILTE